MRVKPQSWMKCYRTLGVLLALLGVAVQGAQSPPTRDSDQISRLLVGLSDHSLRPSDVLDPNMDSEARTSNLEYFADPSYQLSLISAGPLEIRAEGLATIPVRVHFKTENREIEARSTAEFVKRGHTWYFANFSFLGFSIVIIGVIVAGALIGVLYMTGVLILRSKLLRKDKLCGANPDPKPPTQ